MRSVLALAALSARMPYYSFVAGKRSGEAMLVTNVREEWAVSYFNDGWMHSDPVFQMVRARVSPFRWHEPELRVGKYQRFWQQARRFGVDEGITAMVNSSDGRWQVAFSLAGRRVEDGERAAVEEILLRAIYELYEQAIAVAGTWRSPIGVLGESLLQVLVCKAKGMTNQEVANRLHKSLRCIEDRQRRIVEHLGVANLAQAVAYAIHLGVLDAEDLFVRVQGDER